MTHSTLLLQKRLHYYMEGRESSFIPYHRLLENEKQQRTSYTACTWDSDLHRNETQGKALFHDTQL